MVITRSKAASGQTPGAVASSRAHPPGNVSAHHQDLSQQSSLEGGVEGSIQEVGGRLADPPAAGKERQLTNRTCRSVCLSCPDIIRKKTFNSFTTGKTYNAIDIEPHQVHCKLQNYIYLLSCKNCGLQYVGESIRPVNLRMNTHRKAKQGCEISINHYKHVCPGATFSIQIIEKLEGDGYKNGALDTEVKKYRLQREDFWIKRLRTVYPYGLNDRVKDGNSGAPVGKLFPPLPRHSPRRLVRERRRVNQQQQIDSLDSLFLHIHTFHFSERGNALRKKLECLKRKTLNILANEASTKLPTCTDQEKRILELVIDTYMSKVFKVEEEKKKKFSEFVLPVFFDNKGLEYIHLGSILRNQEVVSLLPEILQQKDPPSVVFSLGNTIRSKLFNYKQTVESIDTEDSVTYGTGIAECDCHNNPNFVDDHHGHVLTGDLRIITNAKLRKLICKGPNFREPRSINWEKCVQEIETGLDRCINNIVKKVRNVSSRNLSGWRNAILQRVNQKVESLKTVTKKSRTKPVLKNNDVITYLNSLHQKYVLVPIDKAANNVAVICKKYYVEVILREIGVLGGKSSTYSISKRCKAEIIDDNITFNKSLNLKNDEKDNTLPSMYWLPKLHKNPIKSRFIIASKFCSTKPLSQAVSKIFGFIYKQVESFHTKAKFLSNYNKFWVLQNVDPILEKLKTINRRNGAKSISTYDFSTLYTTLPHKKLIERLDQIIDFVFNGGEMRHLNVSSGKFVSWGRKSKTKPSFTKSSLKMAVKHLIEDCFFTVGNCVLKQDIGIPMGIDPAPFWANLFLYTYESEYISNLINSGSKDDKVKARHFHSTKRFIDDLCTLNDGGMFGNVFKDIYPPELDLKLEHSGTHGTFLNLDIEIRDGKFIFKLYDKRDAFPFSIVRMPHMESNIPKSTFYSALMGEFLRIGRSSLLLQDFLPRAKELLHRMRVQGSNELQTHKSLSKLIRNHLDVFTPLNPNTNMLLETVLSQ